MHVDNLLFILLGLALVVLRWLAQRAAESKKKPPPNQPERPTRASAESEEERMRRFMEALGNPVGSKPPPKVMPRPLQPPRTTSIDAKREELERQSKRAKKSIWTGPLPPLTTAPPAPPAQKRLTLPQLIKRPPVEQKTFQPFTPAAPFEVVEESAPPPPPPRITTPASAYAAATQRQPRGAVMPNDVQSLLSSPDGLRNAVILREILGAPRAFAQLEAF